MPLRTLLLILIILHSSFVILPAAPPPELALLRAQYEKAVAERVTQPFETALSELNTRYAGGIDRAIADAKAAGKLEEIIALEAEKKRLTGNLPIPAIDDEAEPQALKKFRSIYRQQKATIVASRDTAHAGLLPPYTARLKELEATLTRNDRVEEAKEVLAYRQGLGTGLPVAPTSPATMPAATPPAAVVAVPPASPPADAPKVKGDDRKAAEWIVANWSECRLIASGKLVKGAADIPKGAFQLTSISIDGRYFTGGKLDGAMLLQNLGGLESVKTLALGSFSNLTDDDLAFIATLSHLEELRLVKTTAITDGAMRHFSNLRELKKLEISELPTFTGVTLSQLAPLPLEEVKVWKCTFSDAGIASLSGFRKLKLLNVESHRGITDASLPHLRALPALEKLFIGATGITPAGLAATSFPHVVSLGCNALQGVTLKEAAPQIAASFPNLTGFQVSHEIHEPEDLAALAHFKKLERIADYGVIGEAAWPGLLELRGLLSFEHNSTTRPLPDAALRILSQLKKLKILRTGDAPPSEAALAAFKKARPDVKVEP